MKKFLAFMVCLLMVFSMVPVYAQAADEPQHLTENHQKEKLENEVAALTEPKVAVNEKIVDNMESPVQKDSTSNDTDEIIYHGDFGIDENGVLWSYIGEDEDVVIPGDLGITAIGAYAFSACNNYGLRSVVIPEGILHLGVGAFGWNTSLETVTMPSTLKTIGESAFFGCEALLNITIPNGVISIGNQAFSGCQALIDIYIPSSVNDIGVGAFTFCDSLSEIRVDLENTSYSSKEGVLYNKTKTELLFCPVGKTGELAIPNSVTSIADFAFYRCAGLTSVSIPNSVLSIGEEAFFKCYSLTSVVIPDSVISIGDWAFSWGHNLTIFGVPGSSAQTYANDYYIPFIPSTEGFYLAKTPIRTKYALGEPLNFSGLSLILVASGGIVTAVDISDCVVSGYNADQLGVHNVDIAYNESTVTFKVTVLEFVYPESNHPYYDNMDETWHYIHHQPADFLAITFSVETFTEGGGVVSSQEQGFMERYPFSVETFTEGGGDYILIYESAGALIGQYTGPELAGQTVYVPGNAFSIRLTSNNMFNSYGFSIDSIELASSDMFFDIEEGILIKYNGPGGQVVIPDSVTSIVDYAFEGCNNLTRVVIPDSVMSIGYWAFEGCYNLTIFGVPSSYAQTYAESQGIPFVPTTPGFYMITPPSKTKYSLGQILDFAGLSMVLVDAGGTVVAVNIADCVVTGFNTNQLGKQTINITYNGAIIPFEVTVLEFIYPESNHPYDNNMNETWHYTHPQPADSLAITFSVDTYVEWGYDYIYLYDGEWELLGEYTGDELAGQTVQMPGNTFNIILMSDGSVTYYGFSLESIVGYTLSVLIPAPGSDFVVDNEQGFIYGFSSGITKSHFEENVQINGNYTIEYSTEILGTGTEVYIVDNTAKSTGTVIATFTIIIFGDVNGDGQISALDALMTLQNASGLVAFNGVKLFAGDVNNSGNISSLDALKILQYASGIIGEF